MLGEGAPWIWDRIEALVPCVGFDTARVFQVMDFHHACEHLSEAASAVAGWNQEEQKTWYDRLKWLLRSGATDKMLAEMDVVYATCKPKDGPRIINYLRTHRQRLD